MKPIAAENNDRVYVVKRGDEYLRQLVHAWSWTKRLALAYRDDDADRPRTLVEQLGAFASGAEVRPVMATPRTP